MQEDQSLGKKLSNGKLKFESNREVRAKAIEFLKQQV